MLVLHQDFGRDLGDRLPVLVEPVEVSESERVELIPAEHEPI
jgi:hypothetical protein